MNTSESRRRARPLRADGRATRSRIESVAAELFSTSGYRGTSLRQIAMSAEVDLATLKYHFGTKAELFAEVYRAGHAALLGLLVPVAAELSRAQNPADLERALAQQVAAAAIYLQENEPWVRMTMFRLLEQPAEVTAVEDALQNEMLSVVDACLQDLRARDLIRQVDSRSLVVLVLTALPTWFLCTRARPSWVGLSDSPSALQQGFTTFFSDLLHRQLLDRT